MKSQESLFPSHLVLLESLTALGLVFLIFMFSATSKFEPAPSSENVPIPQLTNVSIPQPAHEKEQAVAQKTYLIQVTDRKQRPISDAIVTVLDEPQKISRTNKKGMVLLNASHSAKKILVAAFGYTTQTVELPVFEEARPTTARYQMKKNPMAAEVSIVPEKS